MEASPLSQETAQRLLAPHAEGGDRIAVAVSGGPDSMALAFCLAWLAGAARVLALIVEHGLREESPQEARTVAAALAALGIEAEILPWTHETVESRVHVQARAARYGLLIAACKKRGIGKLFLAHHADDQAETVLMRFAKGSGIDGLAGMDSVAEMDGVLLIRPFLSLPKAQLVATCEANALLYVTDPSNAKAAYARGRLRRLGPLLEAEGFTRERLLDLSARAREAKNALDFYTRAFLRAYAQVLAGGAVRLDLAALRGLPAAVSQRAVAWVLGDINRMESYAPERKQLGPLCDWLCDQEEDGQARTLHGCIVQKGALCDKATFLREAAAITECLPLGAGQTLLWDGRWILACQALETGLAVRPLGFQEGTLIDGLAPSLRDLVPQGRVRAALPALWRGQDLVVIPSFAPQEQGVITARAKPPRWA